MESQCPVAIFVFDLRLDLALGPAIRRISRPPENLGSKFSNKGLFDVGAKFFSHAVSLVWKGGRVV